VDESHAAVKDTKVWVRVIDLFDSLIWNAAKDELPAMKAVILEVLKSSDV